MRAPGNRLQYLLLHPRDVPLRRTVAAPSSGFVVPLEPLTAREINERYPSENERLRIAYLLHTGESTREVATALGCSPPTTARGFARNSIGRDHCGPFLPEGRSESGHWEGDRIIGKVQGAAIGTLVERRHPEQPPSGI